VKPLMESAADISYARQIPAPDSDVAECFTRAFNYPDKTSIKSKEDLGALGIKTYFCSNVCAAYKRQTFEKYGEFVAKTIFNEDMIFAAKVIDNGGSVAYAADAQVIHAHHYTNMQQFKRNFDLAVSQAEHPEVFAKVSSESEGVRYVEAAYVYFKSVHKGIKIIPFVITCGYKYIGFWLGHRYQRFSEAFIMKCTMNQNYWRT
jgi:rhamnosyltransferase